MNSGLAALIVVFFFFSFGKLSEYGKQFLINTHCPRDRAENNFGRTVPVNIGAL